jgi:hypothetical protein
MTNLTKLISFGLLIIFVGLLGFGLILGNLQNQHMNHTGCFGAGCGPVEHVVYHSYIVSELANSSASADFNRPLVIAGSSLPQAPYIKQESPPPNFFLV